MCLILMQTDLATSMKALLKLVEVNQLSFGLDGTAHGYCDWLELHQVGIKYHMAAFAFLLDFTYK